jgi:predicted nucleotidyltransferase
MGTSTNQVMPELKKYIRFLGNQIEIEKIILFGTYAKCYATDQSDVDVAIITSQLGKAPLLEKMKLFEWRYDANIEADIQPVPIGLNEYEGSSSFFIKK